MPMLQEHQLRVAAVAEMICEHMNALVDKENVLKACLLHDMGNIIKFKLGYFPDSLEPNGLRYWQEVQDEYIKKYGGSNEHIATIEIANELGVNKEIIELINSIGFITSEDNRETQNLNKKICAYADMRVAVGGVVSLEERFTETRQRYMGDSKSTIIEYDGKIEEDILKSRKSFEDNLTVIEQQIFEKCTIKPENINDLSVKSIVEKLKNYEI